MIERRKKVLLIKLSSLGDVVFNIPLANILKKNNYEVHWLTSEKGFEILNGNPCVDRVVLAPIEKWKKEKCCCKKIKEFLELVKPLRAEKYDIVIDTQMRLKSLFFTSLSNAKRKIISKDAKEFSFLGANEIIPKTRDGFSTHIVESYLKFAQYLGLNTDEIILTLPNYSDEAKDIIEQLNSDLNPDKKTILISPATTWIGKHWNKDNFKELVSKFGDKYNLIYTGTAKDLELIDYIKSDSGINLAGKTNLKELIEVLKRVDLVISLDSGITHLAWATQIPKILSIYCATPKSLYSPIGEKYIGIQSENCIPCHHKKCTKKENKYSCTLSPDADFVYEKACELIEK